MLSRRARTGPRRAELPQRPADRSFTEDGQGLTFRRLPANRQPTARTFEEAPWLRVEDATTATLIVIGPNRLRRIPQRAALRRPRSRPSQSRSDRRIEESVRVASCRSHRDHRLFSIASQIDLGSPLAADLPTAKRIRRFSPPRDADPHLLSLLFQYGRYLLIASSRPGSQPANLQGIWNHEMRPPWSSNFTININTEMNYWPAETTHLESVTRRSCSSSKSSPKTGKETAKVNYGCRGWVATTTAISGGTRRRWARSAKATQSGLAGRWAQPGSAQHLWEHFAFGGDSSFCGTSATRR